MIGGALLPAFGRQKWGDPSDVQKGERRAVTTNAIWRADDVTIRGDTASWKDATDARHFDAGDNRVTLFPR
jgi:hypothetical protein